MSLDVMLMKLVSTCYMPLTFAEHKFSQIFPIPNKFTSISLNFLLHMGVFVIFLAHNKHDACACLCSLLCFFWQNMHFWAKYLAFTGHVLVC